MAENEKIPWKRLALEAVAIVGSILLAFAIDAWWEDRKEARLEVVYILELQEDFEQNKIRLQREIAEFEETARSMSVLQEQAALESPSMSVSELNESFSRIIDMSSFYPVNRAYENMAGSGDLKLIQSRPLKNALAEYYAAAQITLMIQNTHEMELVQVYEPYIIENLDYAAVGYARVDDFPLPPPIEEASILEVLATREFRNILIQKLVITTDLINQFRQMLERTNNTLALLKSANREATSESSSDNSN